MILGNEDDGAREPRRARSAAIGLGNAHDVDALHLLCGPQHAHDYVGRPAAAVDGRRRRPALQARLSTEDHLLLELASDAPDRQRPRSARRACFSSPRAPRPCPSMASSASRAATARAAARSRRAGTRTASHAATHASIAATYRHTRTMRVWSANSASWSSAFL